MNLNDRMKKIDDFFSKLTNEEFENMLNRCGVDEIKSSKEEGMELSLNISANIINKMLQKDNQNLYITENEYFDRSNVDNSFQGLNQEHFTKAA